MYKTLFEHLKQTLPSYSDEGFINLIKRMTLKEVKKKTIVQEEGKISKENFNHIYINFVDHKEFIRLKRIRHHDATVRKVLDLNTTAEIRYANMLKRYPGIEHRVPYYSLASYLGITPESFSRLRKKLQSKENFLS
jgi:hypothetical protein